MSPVISIKRDALLKSKIEISGLVILIISLFFALRLNYRFSEPREIAKQFVDSVLKGNMAPAYSLTSENLRQSRNLQQFIRILREQLPDLRVHPNNIKIKIQKVTPTQTYGQRLGRWLRRAKVEPDEVKIDTKISTAQSERYLQIRFSQDAQGHWEITSFEAFDK